MKNDHRSNFFFFLLASKRDSEISQLSPSHLRFHIPLVLIAWLACKDTERLNRHSWRRTNRSETMFKALNPFHIFVCAWQTIKKFSALGTTSIWIISDTSHHSKGSFSFHGDDLLYFWCWAVTHLNFKWHNLGTLPKDHSRNTMPKRPKMMPFLRFENVKDHTHSGGTNLSRRDAKTSCLVI